MKKIFILTLILLLVTSFALSVAGCGSYNPPIIPDNPYEDGGNSSSGGGTTTKPGEEEEQLVFTVTLYSEGKRFSPSFTFYAQWTSEDKTEIVNAPFNALGVAQTKGLDGEYRVTLSGLPDDYTYDPNGNYVDNDNRDINIDLLPIIKTRNKGTDYYSDCIELSKLGTYRYTFTSRDEMPWFRYYPTAQGKYVIESWVDIYENEINPVMIHYSGSTQYINLNYPAGTYDDGGTSSTYTKNFRFELELASNMVGNVWAFRLYADCKGEYPINVDFTIKLIGDYSGPEDVYEVVAAQGPFLKTDPAGTWTYNYADNGKVLDSSRFKLNKDGFYYLYDEEKYSLNGGWGPMLFAKLNKDCEAMNYSEDSVDQGGFSNELIYYRLRFGVKDYMAFMSKYFDYCNKEGAHPVTAELREFLQLYAIHASLFMDGEGIAEKGRGLSATEEDMWLFACGYYL